MYLSECITNLKGIGPKRKEALNKIGIYTIKDFFYYFPKNYEDRRKIRTIDSLHEGEEALICGRILSIKDQRVGKRYVVKLMIQDDTGEIDIFFFHKPYFRKSLSKDTGKAYEIYGKVSSWANRLQMIQPDFNLNENDRGILPVYSLTKGITQKNMRTWQKNLQPYLSEIIDFMPLEIIKRNRLCGLQYAIENIHFPNEYRKIKEAKYRLIFDELFLFQLRLFYIKNSFVNASDGIVFSDNIKINEFVNSLPFELTEAQNRVVMEIEQDMESKKTMNRLIQGDVGSGKTIVAASAIYKAAKSGYQAIMMVPTEVLARQHVKGLKEIFKPFGICVELLTGSLKAQKRYQVLEGLRDGKIHLLIGTHAVIQTDVKLKCLGLVITDEQHRFGVNQRELLLEKGVRPDVLVMSATPIPRTLAMTLYADLELSTIDEMPPGRRPIITKTIRSNDREIAYKLIYEEIKSGCQAYIVAPLIEDSSVLEVKSAVELYRELTKKFNEFNVELLHGEMKQSEKDSVMEAFYMGTIDILISTIIIEVGINVPNATVMLIENAERFGLATLHQLRGRVGRGGKQSYCILINEGKTELSKKRLKILEESNNGFYIAEKDLELRGPGDLFGMRQHGIPEFKIADLSKHKNILNISIKEATDILKKDSLLLRTEYKNLKKQIKNE